MENRLFIQLAHKLVAYPQVYDLVQNLVGVKQVQGHMQPFLAHLENQLVLDVGSGTGLYRSVLPAEVDYIGLDLDPMKLVGLQERVQDRLGILLADATRICLQDKCVDVALCVFLGHHLTDEQVKALMRELARVVNGHLLFVEPLNRPQSKVSNLLWFYDRGSHPRTLSTWQSFLKRDFDIEEQQVFSIYDEYLLCWCKPKQIA